MELRKPSTKFFITGERVTFNGGFAGSIIRHYDGNMWEVRSASGTCCIDASDIEKIHATK